jgi:hypothetical protein
VPYLVYLKVAQLSAIALDAGSITAGDFYGTTMHGGTGYPTNAYAWPVNSGNGFHLSASGLLLGNANLGKYAQLDANGDIHTPQFTSINGAAVFYGALSAATGTFAGALSAATGTFSGSLLAASGTFSGSLTASAVNAVDTINLAGQAVTIPVGANGGSVSLSTQNVFVDCVSVGITSSGASVFINWAVNPNSTIAGVGTRLLRDGSVLATFRIGAACYKDTPGAGSHTYLVQAAYLLSTGSETVNNSTIMCAELKR